MQVMKLVTLAVAVVFLLLLPDRAGAQVESGVCGKEAFSLQDIPVANFAPPVQMPELSKAMRLTQAYNTSLEGKRDIDEPYCKVGEKYFDIDSPQCENPTRFYFRHDGLDIHENPDIGAGVNPIFSIQKGFVVVSSVILGWGESIIIATRPNEFSEEIITHHYHHLHDRTRKVSFCSQVQRGDEIGKEGGSGGYPVHLHLGMRRWKNIVDLKAAIGSRGSALAGSGYSGSNSNTSHINVNHLDPEGILYNFFRDYQWESGQEPGHAWSLLYVKEMRELGIEFGMWTGEYGHNEVVKRSEAARWVKIAAQRESARPQSPTFADVPLSHDESVYIEALTGWPSGDSGVSVLNPEATCEPGAKKFCPDVSLTRAQAVKMVTAAFYPNEFQERYTPIWYSNPEDAETYLSLFRDVTSGTWYAPFVVIAKILGIISDQTYFRPEEPITRAEMAKLLVQAMNFKTSMANTACSNMTCPVGQYCELSADFLSGSCKPIAACIPSESRTCEVGGGYVPEEEPPSPEEVVCLGGTEVNCDGVCRDIWSDSTDCGSCGNVCDANEYCSYGVCIPGTQSPPNPNPTTCSPNDMQPCGNCGVKTCSPQGTWYSCTNEGECAPGGEYQESCGNGGTLTATCTSSCRYQPGACVGESSCVSGAQETRQCGAVISNAQSRTCGQNGQWGDWGVCAPVGVCQAGHIVQESCSVGMNAEGQMVAGTRTQTCQNNGQWGPWGVCEPNPECTSGQTDSTACNGGNGTQQRTCTSAGYWGIWGNCNVSPTCSQGQSQQRSCTVNGQVGLETRQCGSNGQWASTWSSCVVTPTSQCQCSSGECCDGCHFKPAGSTCEQGWAYRCQGNNPGQDAEQAQVRTFCSGSSSACNGETVQYSWIIMEDCGNTQVCSTSGGSPHCVANQDCTDTFTANRTRSCSGGTPNLCLEISKVSGSRFKYRVCKDDGTFDNSFTYQLKDTSQGVNFSQYTGSTGSTCSSWQNFDVAYISGYGSIAGAGLVAEVTSPSGCTQSSCRYNSGGITIRKECL